MPHRSQKSVVTTGLKSAVCCFVSPLSLVALILSADVFDHVLHRASAQFRELELPIAASKTYRQRLRIHSILNQRDAVGERHPVEIGVLYTLFTLPEMKT